MEKKKREKKVIRGQAISVANRRIYRIGGSAGITIPWSFLRRNGLGIGDEVGFVFDHVLKVVPLQEKL